MPTTINVTYTRTGTTRNRFRFSEVDAAGRLVTIAEAKIGDIYVKKIFFGEVNPQGGVVTFAFTAA